jgi:hypothetical protein
MATTVEDLYRQILGREPDAGGLAYWQNAFGNSVDATEQASFMQAAQAELAKRTPAEQAALAPKLVAQTSASATQNQPAISTPPTAVVPTLKQQILSQNTTSQWTGEGYGGAEANASAIAKLLADAGITDIKQFGKVDKYEPVDVIGKTYNGNRVYQTGEDGSYYYSKPTGETDYDGNPIYQAAMVPQGAKVDNIYGIVDVYGEGYTPIDSSKVVVRDGVPTAVTGQTFGNKVTGQAIQSGSGRWQNQGGEGLFSGTGEGKGNTAFRAQFAPDGTPIFYTTQGSSSDVSKGLMTALSLAAGYFAPGVGNALLGAGANQIAAGALGGSLLGGGLAAATGQNVLKGALTGGIGGAIAGYFSPATGEITSVPTEGSVPLSGEDISRLSNTDLGIDYSLSNGTGMKPLTDMGGAQGLQAGTSANLANMGGAQGITLNLGPASTTLANALSTFGGMNPANLDAMGGGQGLTYQTPTGVVTQGGLIPTGGMTGNNNVIGETGINTAYNIGNGIGDALAAVDTGVSQDMLTSNGVNNNNNTVATSGLTTSQLTNLATAGLNVAGLLGVTSALSGGTGGSRSVGALPTQGVPLNSDDYFQAIQRNYNALLPAVPRDVASPLRDWYNSAYGGGTTPVTNVTPITPQTATGGMFNTAATNPLINTPVQAQPVSPQIMPAAPTTAAMSPQQSAQTIQEMPKATSVDTSSLSPAQSLYYNELMKAANSGPESTANYVKSLSDYQALASMNSGATKVFDRSQVPWDFGGTDEAAILANRYGIKGPISMGSGVSIDYGSGTVTGRPVEDVSIGGGSILTGRAGEQLMSGVSPEIMTYLQSLPQLRNA